MLTVTCLVCLGNLKEPGALLFSPPTPGGTCAKYHICVDCWDRYPNVGAALLRFIQSPRRPEGADEIEVLFDGAWELAIVRAMRGSFIDYTRYRSLTPGSVLYASDLWRWPIDKALSLQRKKSATPELSRRKPTANDYIEILTGSGWRRVRVISKNKYRLFYAIFRSSKHGSILISSKAWRWPRTPPDPIETGGE